MRTFCGSLLRTNEAREVRCFWYGPARNRFLKPLLSEGREIQFEDFSLGCRRFMLGRKEARCNECALA